MDIPRITDGSGDLQAELQRLEREIEDLRARLAQDAAPSDAGTDSSDATSSDGGRRGRDGRTRRLARTSRADSHLIGSRPLRAVSSTDDPAIAEVIASVLPLRAARPEPIVVPGDDDEDDGPQAA